MSPQEKVTKLLLLALSVAFWITVYKTKFSDTPWTSPYALPACFLIAVATIPCLFTARRYWPVLIGAALNFIVIVANGGYMPVVRLEQGPIQTPWVLAQPTHVFLWLADRPELGYASVGDLVILAGLFGVLVRWLNGLKGDVKND